MPADALTLHPDRPLRLDPARHAELRVLAGIVWITAGSDDTGDRFLGTGERYAVPRAGLALAEAVRGDARVELRPAPCRAERWRLRWPGAALGV